MVRGGSDSMFLKKKYAHRKIHSVDLGGGGKKGMYYKRRQGKEEYSLILN